MPGRQHPLISNVNLDEIYQAVPSRAETSVVKPLPVARASRARDCRAMKKHRRQGRRRHWKKVGIPRSEECGHIYAVTSSSPRVVEMPSGHAQKSTAWLRAVSLLTVILSEVEGSRSARCVLSDCLSL